MGAWRSPYLYDCAPAEGYFRQWTDGEVPSPDRAIAFERACVGIWKKAACKALKMSKRDHRRLEMWQGLNMLRKKGESPQASAKNAPQGLNRLRKNSIFQKERKMDRARMP